MPFPPHLGGSAFIPPHFDRGCVAARRGRRHYNSSTHDPRELRLLLERHGLKIERMWGNYDGTPLGLDSPRMIACCRRRR
ncbi:MAG: hypothetical protein ACREIT_10980 [Tepidisphaeraceae bacterium]